MRSLGLLCMLLALMVPQLGCGKGKGERVTVSGFVTLDGNPVEGATVAFIGGGGGALEVTTSDKDGLFKLDAAPGPNRVTVTKEELSTAAPTSEAEMTMGTDAQYKEQLKHKPKSIVPPKYSTPDTSGLSFDIAKGMDPVKLVLSSK